MSFWSKISTVVRDLEIFKNACEKNGVEYEDVTGAGLTQQGYPVVARLTDKVEGGPTYNRQAYLVEADGAYRLVIDNDTGYSSLSKRLGKNGGTMMRDYTQESLERSIIENGGMVTDQIVKQDGSVVVKWAVNG